MRLENKVALVTGAASGFGAEIARVFAREGAKVALLDINGDGAAAVAPKSARLQFPSPPMSPSAPTSTTLCARPWMLSAA